MVNLFLRSTLVLALLFGLFFAVGMAFLTYFDLPPIYSVAFALGILLLQFLLGPLVLQWIYKIQWTPESYPPETMAFIEQTCAAQGLPKPRLGIINDGNPNAFTFGHYPGDARLVVTSGLLEMLDTDEQKAVVAHELGHIKHWDFVVMTVAAAIPLLLYVIYRATQTRGSRKGGEYIILVGLVSYIAYILSHYIVLMLSRVREYYADQFSVEATRNPNALSTALVKVAYGLAAGAKKDDNVRMEAGRAFGIFDPKVAQSLALASAGQGTVSADAMEGAMKWDLWNPWAKFFELSSTHPLPAQRIRALERMSAHFNQVPHYSFRAEQPESYWDEFFVDLFFNYLPAAGFLLGVGAGIYGFMDYPFAAAGVGVLVWMGAWWIQRRFSYRPDFDTDRTIRSLIGEVKVSKVRSIPCTLQGTIIGRGVPGLFYSEDLVLQDDTGFITLDYRQPLRIFEFLFGAFKAEKLILHSGRVTGWYRRGPAPRLEMRHLFLDNGAKVTSFNYPLAQFFVYFGVAVGLALIVAEFLTR